MVSLITRYLSGKCSKQEAQKVVAFIENPENDPELQAELGSHWTSEHFISEALSDGEKEIMDKVLDRLPRRISLAREQHHGNVRSFRYVLSVFSRVAAILILPLLAYSVFVTMKMNTKAPAEVTKLVWQTVKTPAGMQTDFLLPDGSHVWLNSGSVFKYPVSFASDFRQVELTGEAFFDVVKDASSPFLVQAGKMNIEVKGTRFDVINYPDETLTELILESGSVKLFSGKYSDHQSIANIRPGQSASLDNTNNKLTIGKVDIDKYTAWKEGKLIFKDDRMDEVVRKLNRWFNVDIILKSPELNEYVYTATYRDETLNQILELLTISAPIRYFISERERQTDNSFSKRKIVLTKRKI
jgi:ferric-dicitrate binding protein FerR (iron transport regulator)